jgi:hypothetical protein
MKKSEYVPLRIKTTIETLDRPDLSPMDKAQVIHAAYVSSFDDFNKIVKFHGIRVDEYSSLHIMLMEVSTLSVECAKGFVNLKDDQIGPYVKIAQGALLGMLDIIEECYKGVPLACAANQARG